MSHSYSVLLYHCVWATKRRALYVSAEVEPAAYGYIHVRCEELGIFVYALNGMPDHVHLVCSIPPRLAVADALDKIKGSSSHYVSHLPDGLTCYWQEGYSVHSFAKRDLPRIVEYVERQKEHHRVGALWDALEQLGPEPPKPPQQPE